MSKSHVGRKPVIVEGVRLDMYVWPTGRCEWNNGIEIRPIVDGGRPYVMHKMYGRSYRVRLDHLVASTFMEKPIDVVRLIHLNNDPLDCHIDNLHWLTRDEIIQHYIDDYSLTPDIAVDETWRTVDTERGPVDVSSRGNVRDPDTKNPLIVSEEHGYLVIHYWNPITQRPKVLGIHRLVATAFIPNPNNYRIVNHLDCDKQNNSVYNLEWCDDSMNSEHAVANVRQTRISKDTIERAVELMNSGKYTDIEISKITGLSRKYISKIRHRGPRKDVYGNLEPQAYKRWDPSLGDDIVELLRQGKTRREIFETLKLDRNQSTISYYERVHKAYSKGIYNKTDT